VITGGVITPDPPLKPEGGYRERSVIGRGGAGPNVRQAVRALYQRILGNEQVIVPDEAGAHRRDVADDRGENDEGAEEKAGSKHEGENMKSK